MTAFTPYDWQERFWKRWEATAQPRLLISCPTGGGKTFAGVRLFEQYPQVIISGTGLTLEPWKRDVPGLAVIDTGPRKSLSKPAKARIEAALNAPVLFMTPALLPKWIPSLPHHARKLLLLDEAHMYDDPATARSEWLCDFLAANPSWDVLALTATFMRKEIQDVWSLANMFAPDKFPGRRQPNEHRRVSYSFLARFCQRDPDMGFFFGAKLDQLPELKERLRSFVEFVEPEEILSTCPKAQINLSSALREDLIEDLKLSTAESKLILFQHREVAAAYAAQLGWPLLTGETVAATRVAELSKLREAYANGQQANFVGTWGAFSEAVSLAWVERTVLFEPPTTPGQIEQLMGRFQRPEPAQRVPAIITIEASAKAMARLAVLQERSSQADAIQGISPKVAGLLEAVSKQQLAPVSLALAADYDPDIDYAIRLIDGEFDDESGDLG